MDSPGFNQIGRHGTLSLLKRQEPDTVVTAFGIDSEELTFGRDPKCSVRLYYPDVNLVHCKIIFSERKAFLLVLGSTGLLVDGCKVYPNGSPGAQPTTIPLSNNSEIEIHNKRFRFSYPPKEIRAALYATPARPNRKLRLSMINSAQVFSPRPSNNPRENLRILQSPLKNAFRSPGKPSTLLQPPISSSDIDDEEESIILVDGNYPRVVEEDKDLVILEDVEIPTVQPTTNVQPPKTPQRARTQSLHRAVLIRSVQRAVLQHESQRRQEEEDREEEMEVLETVASNKINSDEGVNHNPEEAEHPPSDDEDTDSDEEEGEEKDQDRRKSLWRKSLERLWPFKGSNPANEEIAETSEIPRESDTSDGEHEDDMHEAQDQAKPLRALPQATPNRRPLGNFMTPQVAQQKTNTLNPDLANLSTKRRLAGGPPSRFSLGGEARRVPFEPIWRVKDIIIPVKGEVQEEMNIEYENMPSPVPKSGDLLDNNISGQASPLRARPPTSSEERMAIKERRRSALREIDSGFEGVPGMSPSKPFTSPTKGGFDDMHNPFRPASPIKLSESRSSVKDITRRLSTDDEDEKLDTRSLLERMKETVEGMKRRRSTIGTSGPSPTKNSNILNSDKGSISLDPLPNAQDREDHSRTVDEAFPSETINEINHLEIQTGSKAEPGRTLRSTAPEKTSSISVPIVVEEATGGEKVDALPDALVQNARAGASNLEVPVRRSKTRSRSPQPPAEPTKDPVRRTRQATARMELVDRSRLTKAPPRRTSVVDPEKSSSQGSTLTQGGPTGEEVGHNPVVGRPTRKITVKEEKADKPLRQPARRGRQPRAAPETEQAAKETKDTAGRIANSIEVNKDDDPLDSLNASKTNAESGEVLKVVGEIRKTQRAVKQEDRSIEASKSTRSTRTARTNDSAKTPAPIRGRSRKTPATAPAAVTAEVEVDKENAPRLQQSTDPSRKDVLDSSHEGVVVKVRTTRRTKAQPVKQEEDAINQRAVKARVTRSRARTKTT